MAEQQILPCPYCKGGIYISHQATEGGHRYQPRCSSRECEYHAGKRFTEAEAIAAHNTVSRNNAAADDLLESLKNVLSKLPNERADYSGVGYCAGCGAVLWVSGDDSPRDPCKPGCVLVAARAAIRKATGADE